MIGKARFFLVPLFKVETGLRLLATQIIHLMSIIDELGNNAKHDTTTRTRKKIKNTIKTRNYTKNNVNTTQIHKYIKTVLINTQTYQNLYNILNTI